MMSGTTHEPPNGACWHSVSCSMMLAGKAIAVASGVFAGMTRLRVFGGF